MQAIIAQCTPELSSTISSFQAVWLVTRNLEFEKTSVIQDRTIGLGRDGKLVSPIVKRLKDRMRKSPSMKLNVL